MVGIELENGSCDFHLLDIGKNRVMTKTARLAILTPLDGILRGKRGSKVIFEILR